MTNYTVTTTSEQEKAIAYALDSFNVGQVTPLTKEEYVQVLFNQPVNGLGSLDFFEDTLVADAYENANPGIKIQVDQLLGVVKK